MSVCCTTVVGIVYDRGNINNSLMQWFSNFFHQVPPQKILGSPSTTITTNIKIQ